jgi:hypothetical protein
MGGNYPDGCSQADIDRAHDGGDEPDPRDLREIEWAKERQRKIEEVKRLQREFLEVDKWEEDPICPF